MLANTIPHYLCPVPPTGSAKEVRDHSTHYSSGLLSQNKGGGKWSQLNKEAAGVQFAMSCVNSAEIRQIRNGKTNRISLGCGRGGKQRLQQFLKQQTG